MNLDKYKLEKLVGKQVIVFTKNGFRFSGNITDFSGRFYEIFDEVKHKRKMIAIDEIAEIEISE